MKTICLKIIVISFLLISCKKEAVQVEPSIFLIEKPFKTYLTTFIKEAKLRNIIIDTTNLILRSATASSNLSEICGTCTQTPKKPTYQKTIKINTSSSLCWAIATNNAKEALVFHELGHCLLGREHKKETFEDGTPVSIMFADNFDLYSPCVYAIDNTNECNKTERRKYYLDELFDSKTKSPSWAK